MAVTSVKTLSRRAGNFASGRVRTYEHEYIIETDDSNDGQITVLGSLPQVGETFSIGNDFDSGSVVSNIDIEDISGDQKKWRAKVKWDSVATGFPTNRFPSQDQTADVEDRDSIYGVRFDSSQEIIEGAYSDADPGNLDLTTSITNSAGQPFQPPPTRDVVSPVIVVSVDSTVLALDDIAEVQDTINSTSFAGFPQHTLKLNVTEAIPVYEDNRIVWQKKYELAYRRSTWQKFILDRGFVEDQKGNVKPVKLDGTGQPTTGAPTYLQFRVYKLENFATSPFLPDAVKDLNTLDL